MPVVLRGCKESEGGGQSSEKLMGLGSPAELKRKRGVEMRDGVEIAARGWLEEWERRWR